MAAKLIFSAIASLDGYVADEDGKWDWSMPDHEVHEFVNDLERPIGTHLYGRRMYEVLSAWETLESDEPLLQDYAQIWRGTDKVVFSKTLDGIKSKRTWLERDFDPAVVAKMKATSAKDIAIGGPELAAVALRAGIVDEIHLLLSPVVVGGGKAALPAELRLELELLSTQRFGNGVVHLHYRVK
jgi:dihydrofolate reductase